jgi:hypothetical protein
MAGVNKRKNGPVVIIEDLDLTIRNMTFDYFVLNRYGNYDKTIPYNYLHADVIDIHNVCTANVIIGGSFINFHKDELTKGNHLRIEDFILLTRAKFERGDLDLSLWLISSTEVLILDKLNYSLHFFHVDTIVSFNKRIHDKWMTTSIAIVVI